MAVVSKFSERVYAVLMKVPKGYVTTYSSIANALDCKAYRAIGNALNKNPYAPSVPCHRVVNKNGSLGGFAKGATAKIILLKNEGINVVKGKVVDFETKLWRFNNQSER